MRNLKLVLVLALVTFLGFQSNAAVAINTANTEVVVSLRHIIDSVIGGRSIQITSNETGNVYVTVVKISNNAVILQDILTPGDVRNLNNLAIGAYVIIATYESTTQTQTVIIE